MHVLLFSEPENFGLSFKCRLILFAATAAVSAVVFLFLTFDWRLGVAKSTQIRGFVHTTVGRLITLG